jgi:hypothetical protein
MLCGHKKNKATLEFELTLRRRGTFLAATINEPGRLKRKRETIVEQCGSPRSARAATEFRQEAAVDPKHEDEANPNEVGEALQRMAAEMERRLKYFDPELPKLFRFLADPMGPTKTVVYGAVKSAENVITFLAQRALGIWQKTVEAVQQHISRVVATLILLMASAALKLSGALPQGWAWLRPLLEILAKPVGGG